MDILTIVGARPQFIKAAPVSQELAAAGVREVLLHTGQHYDTNMSDVFFTELGLREPDCHLGVGSGSHAGQTAAMLTGIERALEKERPDWLLVYGDTNSTLAGALAASKLHVPIAHVEAGLRSFNRRMPEEVNRIVADQLSELLFTPTRAAEENLRREGFPAARIVPVGDVMFDAIELFRPAAARRASVLSILQVPPRGYVLATIHRAENTDDPQRLRTLFAGLAEVAATLPVVLPVHPRTRRALNALSLPLPSQLHLLEPQGFLSMQRLEMEAAVIATDSGGVQKEACWHQVPCVTLRDETEWVELLESGANVLCPPVDAAVVASTILAARQRKVHAPPQARPGAVSAARAIVQTLVERQTRHP